MKKPKPKKPKKPKPKKPKPKKPKKPKQPKKPKKPKRPGKPDPDKQEKKPGKKPQKPLKPKLRLSRIPAACKPFVGSPQLLDCWLDHNPKVAEAIVWEPTPNSFLAWPAWTNAMKAQLRQAWLDARAWHANGLTAFTGTFVEDPPPNQDLPGDSGWLRTVLDGPTQWWPLYLAHVAHCLAAEIGDWGRLSGRSLGAYLGLVPTEYSSGSTRVQGGVTKTGNSHARRLLVEAAWHHRARYRPGQDLRRRWDAASPAARARGQAANARLHARWTRFDTRKKCPVVANAAIARELAGWCWSLAVLDE